MSQDIVSKPQISPGLSSRREPPTSAVEETGCRGLKGWSQSKFLLRFKTSRALCKASTVFKRLLQVGLILELHAYMVTERFYSPADTWKQNPAGNRKPVTERSTDAALCWGSKCLSLQGNEPQSTQHLALASSHL